MPCPRSLLLALALAFPAAPQDQHERHLLELRIAMPINVENTRLQYALQDIGVLLKGDYVLFGVEQWLKKGKEPTVTLRIEAGANLQDALDQILGQLPGYTYRFISDHMINLYPAAAEDDPNDPLNTIVPKVKVTAKPNTIISIPDHFMPELRKRLYGSEAAGELGSVLEGVEPPVTLDLEGATVRQVLNAASESMVRQAKEFLPNGWICSYNVDAPAALESRSCVGSHSAQQPAPSLTCAPLATVPAPPTKPPLRSVPVTPQN